MLVFERQRVYPKTALVFEREGVCALDFRPLGQSGKVVKIKRAEPLSFEYEYCFQKPVLSFEDKQPFRPSEDAFCQSPDFVVFHRSCSMACAKWHTVQTAMMAMTALVAMMATMAMMARPQPLPPYVRGRHIIKIYLMPKW